MNNKIKVAINGFGRIGKIVTKEILENHPNIDLVAINGKSPEQVLQYLKFDTAHGRLKFDAWTEAEDHIYDMVRYMLTFNRKPVSVGKLLGNF